ncbi:helix-turn-helix domain-containing protein [Streptomyces sp. MZ04]|uniref:helix-turn-helix domain-containing protein n=1 Tax=Streptomyces sp. MZ04 TaxID=2559236 RepID=UPI00107EB9DB|nr:helix-turn-helix domain-containing protein [Streptomyces sp. MZ04]TGB14396.1 helix-turn-helix transcriptional regulator [Streptomyces sp. MZ04]
MEKPGASSTPYFAQDSLTLTDGDRELYRRIAGGEHVTERMPELDRLLALGLIIREPLQVGRYLPVPLERAERRLLASEREALEQSVDRLGELPSLFEDLRSLSPRLNEQAANADVQWLAGVDAVNEAISNAADEASVEMLAAQPGERPRNELQKSMSRDAEALRRGVGMRTLYHVSARSNPAVRQRVDVMDPLGGQYRTRGQMFMRCVVIDRKFAVVEDHADGRPASDGGYVFRSPAICAYIADAFDLEWTRAEEWYTEAAEQETVTTQIQRTILRELCVGQDQQQIAKQLGYSSKTINVHLHNLRKRLDFQTLYQVVHWWASPAASLERELD